MARQPVALGLQEGRSRPLATSRLVNFFFEPASLNSRAPQGTAGVAGPLYGTPGIRPFTSHGATAGPVRAKRNALGFLYVLVDGILYREDSSGNSVECTGDAIPPNGVAMMTDNGIQLTVLSGGLSFTVVGTTVAKITSPGYPAAGASSVDTLDGFTIWSTNFASASAVYGTALTITDITDGAAEVVVTTSAAHGLADNTQVLIQSVGGKVELNNREFTIRVLTTTTFQLVGIDGASFANYTSGGTASPVIAQGTGQWFISALYDSAAIDPLQFAAAQAQPDPLYRALVVNREVWLFGAETIEPWQNVGASPFPFARISGAVMNRGTASPLSPTEHDGIVFWLGDDLKVYMATGYQPQRISNFAVEEFIRKFADDAAIGVLDAYGMAYSQAGHTFYVLTFPMAGYTFCFDIGVNPPVWHERRSGTQLTNAVWGVTTLTTWNGVVYAGYSDGQVGILDLDTFTEFGNAIRSAARTPPLFNDGKRATLSTLELECELGAGLNTGQGSDPTVMLRWSDDGGATWSNQREMSIGRTGSRIDRAMARRMGMFRQRTYEFSISDPVKRSFYGYRFEGTGATS